jgi:hypothetical protein
MSAGDRSSMPRSALTAKNSINKAAKSVTGTNAFAVRPLE